MSDPKAAPVRDVRLWAPDLRHETRADGTILVWRGDDLGPVPPRLTDSIDHWAEAAPERTWMAERDGDGWRQIDYAGLRRQVRALGQWLLDMGLSTERPLVILSGNSLEHAVAALAAQYVGVPSAALSPAYSLVAEDYAKLASVCRQVTPGLVMVQDAEPFAAALKGAIDPAIPVLAVTGTAPAHQTHAWETALATEPTHAVDEAHEGVGPETVAKFLFTSGTTGEPKAVIQTNRMLCANQIQIRDCYAYFADEPPVLCDWAPWNHTAAGNKVFNIALWNGGTFHIDGGKPSPKGIEETVRNLREVSPTWYFNVPAGFEALVRAMEADDGLRDSFFRDLKHLMYAGAGMAQHTWDALERLSVEATGTRVLMSTGLGATETGPFALYCTEPQPAPGNVGIPARGVTLKLIPQGDRYEARLKGPNITPGYWRAPDLTAEAFDEEGFYRLGDALRFVEPGEPARGFTFAGRIAENFKLRTGTWVAVGPLRAQLVDQLGGLASDAVIVGEDREALAALLVPDRAEMRKLSGEDEDAHAGEIAHHPKVRAALARRLATHAAEATGSSTRVTRAMVLTEPLSLETGEVTDKGSVNQRKVLMERSELADAVYLDRDDVIEPDEGAEP